MTFLSAGSGEHYGRPMVLLIDGRAGSGKTTLARALQSRLDAQLVSLDDVYPGWDGLRAGSEAVPAMLYKDGPGWRGGIWSDEPGAWHDIDPARGLIVEGCGALSAAARIHSTWGIYLDVPARVRRHRAFAREPGFRQHWRQWARQEREHARREHPRDLADAVIDGWRDA
jgi:uridine kinase